ncbi:MAG: hypothetical protein AAF740_13335 [Bacteroidota bacterium]
MKNVLTQRYFFASKEFVLEEYKLVVRQKWAFRKEEWEANYHELGLDLRLEKSNIGFLNLTWLTALIALMTPMVYQVVLENLTEGSTIALGTKALGVLMLVFWFFLLMCVYWTFQYQIYRRFTLTGGHKDLTFFAPRKEEKKVKAFIEVIRNKRRQKLKEELAAFDPEMTFEEQIESLNYLLEMGAISNEELEEIQEELRVKHLLK